MLWVNRRQRVLRANGVSKPNRQKFQMRFACIWHSFPPHQIQSSTALHNIHASRCATASQTECNAHSAGKLAADLCKWTGCTERLHIFISQRIFTAACAPACERARTPIRLKRLHYFRLLEVAARSCANIPIAPSSSPFQPVRVRVRLRTQSGKSKAK